MMRSIVEELRKALKESMTIGGCERFERAVEALEDLDSRLNNWSLAYPVEVFPELEEGELKHAMALVNAEDPNQSARLYAAWARHIVASITETYR